MTLRAQLYCLTALATCTASAARAADGIALNEICDETGGAGTYTVNPRKLRNFAIRGVNAGLLDANHDDQISANELFAALAYGDFCETAQCSGPEAQAVLAAQNTLASFALQANIRFIERADAPPTDPRLLPGRTPEPHWRLLDEQRRYVRMECIRPDGDTSAPAPNTTRASDRLVPRFLLTKNIDDLTLPRAEGLKNIPQAEISYVDDDIANTETFRVNATAGIAINRSGVFRLIPFVQFIRSHVQDTTGANAPQETSKISAGMLSAWYVGRYDIVDITGTYSNDLEDGAEILSGRLGWRPGFLRHVPSFWVTRQFLCPQPNRRPSGACSIGGSYLGLRSDARVIGTFARVIDSGQNPMLVANRDFLRIGGEVRVTLFGLRGLVNNMSVDASYRHLFSLHGQPDDLSSFNFGVNYWIGGSPHASVRYGYERRQDEDTLKRTDQWTVSLGLRF